MAPKVDEYAEGSALVSQVAVITLDLDTAYDRIAKNDRIEVPFIFHGCIDQIAVLNRFFICSPKIFRQQHPRTGCNPAWVKMKLKVSPILFVFA
ncbi:hypothetical protein ACFS07_33290 [Undibacterium arcticum]